MPNPLLYRIRFTPLIGGVTCEETCGLDRIHWVVQSCIDRYCVLHWVRHTTDDEDREALEIIKAKERREMENAPS